MKPMRASTASCPGAKNAYDSIIGLLATLDSPQTRFIYNVAEYITDPAAHANAAIIGQQEVIHNESYSYVLASITDLPNQNRVFEMARTHPTIIKRNAPIMGRMTISCARRPPRPC
jgi:ribonucleoside-diphosphate reductase beta chain